MTRLLRRLHSRFQNWRLYRAIPELKSNAAKIDAARKAHRPTRALVECQRREMLQALREGR
jgi:hypothetical protein